MNPNKGIGRNNWISRTVLERVDRNEVETIADIPHILGANIVPELDTVRKIQSDRNLAGHLAGIIR